MLTSRAKSIDRRGFCGAAWVLAAGLKFGGFAFAGPDEDDESTADSRFPDRYVVKYPVAERFCPPIRGYFSDVNRTADRVAGKAVSHQANGGFGLPVIMRAADGRNLLHLGADVGWYRVGEPVHAIANGVVRISSGPGDKPGREPAAAEAKPRPKSETRPGKSKADSGPEHQLMAGNAVAIEHRLSDGSFITSFYAHLSNRRLVKVGDIVQAGQKLGEIGKNSKQVNGGFKPHLHFGVRDGRRAEKNSIVAGLSHAGQVDWVRLLEPAEDEIEIQLPDWLNVKDNSKLTIRGLTYPLTQRDGRVFAPARLLWPPPWPGFDLTGYAPTAENWRDPTQFLLTQRADTDPAPYLRGKPKTPETSDGRSGSGTYRSGKD